MSDENEGAATGPEGVGAGVDPVATALALGGASREEADTFLRHQRRLVDLQCEYLADKDKYELSHLRWRRFTEQMKGALQFLTAVVGIVFALGVAVMVWQAAHSDGLRVDSFSVPPELAARGFTGQVAAAKLIDRLGLLQSQTNTARPGRSYSNNWDAEGIKLQIPDTGMSLSEIDSWLREKLGHESHISGEIVRTAAGVAITVCAGEQGAVSVEGPDADMDLLVKRLANSLYRVTQPYRYATYLMRHENRAKEALPIFKDLALNGSPEDRRWSYNMWGQAVEISEGSSEAGLRMYQQAHAADPDATTVLVNLASALSSFGRYEEALQVQMDRLAHLISGKSMTLPAVVPRAKKRTQASISALLGAYHDALPVHADDVRAGLAGYGSDVLLSSLVRDQIGEHDLVAARASQAKYPAGVRADEVKLRIAFGAKDWTHLLGLGDAMAAYLKAQPNNHQYALIAFAPPLALAQAHLGRFSAAERTIVTTPENCYPCLVTRAQVAALQGQDVRADFWFARAVAAGPSIPFADAEWGQALLERHQPDAAIKKFKLSNQKGPHFADPLEGWGEALMAKNQSHLAVAKFAEAEKYAPNWGRLHLKWGEALVYAGKPDEAKKQITIAAGLDLTPSEKAELARMRH